LTVGADCVYARLGQPYVRCERLHADSYIAALEYRPEAADKWRLRWLLPALEPNEPATVVFEGAPIVHGNRLYAALTRLDGNRAMTSVACYDPAGQYPQLVWREDVFETGADAAERTRHLSLTANGSHVVCGPHAGAIVVLDAATGQRAWAARYPSRGSNLESGEPSPRDLCPSIVAGGRLFASPADYDRVLAFDAASGNLLWESDPIEATHMLGVSGGKVVLQQGGLIAGLAALDVATGRRAPDWGYAVFGADAAAPFGRGLFLDDCVYCPTRADGIKVVPLDGPLQPVPAVFQSLPGGNLISGNGCLIVATAERLHVILAKKRNDTDTGILGQ
jgi:hypothetical protein